MEEKRDNPYELPKSGAPETPHWQDEWAVPLAISSIVCVGVASVGA
jgi:hypothetical protein